MKRFTRINRMLNKTEVMDAKNICVFGVRLFILKKMNRKRIQEK